MSPEDAPEHATRDMMRAMAHPVRLEIMERIGRRGSGRAADLAVDLGIPANSVSYHLRILARGGVVVEAPEAARDRRDRVWRLAQTSFRHAPGQDGDYREASGSMSLAAFDWMRAAWAAEISRDPATEPSGGSPAGGTMFATTLNITASQADELADLVNYRIAEYNRMNRDADGVDDLPHPSDQDPALPHRVMFALVADRTSPSAAEPGPA